MLFRSGAEVNITADDRRNVEIRKTYTLVLLCRTLAGYRNLCYLLSRAYMDTPGRAPGPRIDPPLHVQIEHGPGVDDPAQLKRDAEELLRAKLVFTANVEVVAPGTLPRYEMKAQLIQKLYEAPAS